AAPARPQRRLRRPQARPACRAMRRQTSPPAIRSAGRAMSLSPLRSANRNHSMMPKSGYRFSWRRKRSPGSELTAGIRARIIGVETRLRIISAETGLRIGGLLAFARVAEFRPRRALAHGKAALRL